MLKNRNIGTRKHKGSDEPEETEALLHAIPRNDDRDERQRTKDREREGWLSSIGELTLN